MRLNHRQFCTAGGIQKYKWVNAIPTNITDKHLNLCHYGFGKELLKRKSVVSAIIEEREKQLRSYPRKSTSVYLSGGIGTGKTSLLALVAKQLKLDGWEVYCFYSATDASDDIGNQFVSYAKANPHINIAVFVDEVAASPNSSLFNSLLKLAPANVFTVGAAVRRYYPTAASNFRFILGFHNLTLKAEDEDFLAIVRHWKSLNVGISPQMVDFVSKLLLNYCGGHVYSVLAFMEHFFSTDEGRKALVQDEGAFRRHFYSQQFYQSPVYREICSVCFEEFFTDADARKTLVKALSGRGDAIDFDTLVGLGWWDPEKGYVSSTLLLNEALHSAQ